MEAITQGKIDAYDAEMHKILPEITGSLAALAALDFPSYQSFHSLAEELYKLDYGIGKACLGFSDEHSRCIKALEDYWEEAQTMDQRLPQEIADIVERRVSARANRILQEAADLA